MAPEDHCSVRSRHKTVRIQYAVCADNVGAARRELLRRPAGQHVDGYEIEDVVAATGRRSRAADFPDDCVVLLT